MFVIKLSCKANRTVKLSLYLSLSIYISSVSSSARTAQPFYKSKTDREERGFLDRKMEKYFKLLVQPR